MKRRWRQKVFATVAVAVLAAACGSSGGPAPAAETPRDCVPSNGATGSPQTIEEAVALINSLPRPTSVACLVESLDRPLRVSATESIFSAQPAHGRRSPRIFLFSGSLILSVVPDGPGAEVVEFSQLDDSGHSIKGELAFPVEADVPPEAPYTKIMFRADLTNCAFCHANEQPVHRVGTAWAYSSRALRPKDSSLVPLEELRQEASTCDASAEPERCRLLQELFEHGTPRAHTFPASLPTFP
ncbi:hypothetical protein HPC49_16385 [Pyxidicoccus fallax]|uniref:Lipoprotein n=1 Tax=Pyxidicoccus fallax TaxID=394095 RepID=A0A848L7X4_9BACT|nr:hypothetical protein [Pyxidicoccus fallax]NMO15090.1 hypothetical protein [Pyxidicoccus fallax]NPC79796.1 hypothetical protein [Pyxidicoccus fallax]